MEKHWTEKDSYWEGTVWNDQVIAFRCECTFITSIAQEKCWKCGAVKTDAMQRLYGRDFGPTGAIKPGL